MTDRRADIDALRGVAIALVVIYHAMPTWLPAGFLGVDVFFVISGYLITQILCSDEGPGRLARFYGRRVRRLAPALVVVLAAVLVLGALLLLPSERRNLAGHTVGAVLFVANLVLWQQTGYFDDVALERPLLHLWSLGIEEQFYLVWPALVALLAVRRARLAAAGILAIVSFGGAVAVAQDRPNDVFYLPWFRFWELLVGAAVALIPRQPSRSTCLTEAAWLAGLLVLLGSSRWIDPTQPLPSWPTLAPVIATGWLLWSGRVSRAAASLAQPPVRGLGLVSYPLYLWHWPLLSFAEQTLDLSDADRWSLMLLSLFLAVVTYRAVELPIQRLYLRSPRAAVGTLLGALALIGIVAARDLAPRPEAAVETHPVLGFLEREREEDYSLRHQLDRRPCPLPSSAPLSAADSCWRSGGEGPGVVLWGDSTGESWAPLIQSWAGGKAGLSTTVLSFSGCPPLLGVRTPAHPNCEIDDAVWKAEMLQELEPDLIVLSARWGAYVEAPHPLDRSPSHFVTTEPLAFPSRDSSRQAILSTLPTTLETLTTIAPVIMILAPPDLVRNPFSALPRRLEVRPSRADHLRRNALVVQLAMAAASVDPRIRIVDPTPQFCPSESCDAVIESHLAYQDESHVSAHGALLLRERFAAAAASLGL